MESDVRESINRFLDARLDLFLIELKISSNGNIRVIMDGDKVISLQDCIDLSRCIERDLDQIGDLDFSLDVMSAGLTEPIKDNRQYKRRLGRKFDFITDQTQHLSAKLIAADHQGILIEMKGREPKPNGKGKITITRQERINYNQIKQAKQKVTFK